MTIRQIITAALISILFPNEQAMQNARKGVIIDIRQQAIDNNCYAITSSTSLSDQCDCLQLKALLARQYEYVQEGIFYGVQESIVYEITTNNNNYENTLAFPYGDCHHNLMIRTPDRDEPLAIHRNLMSLCIDPITKEYIKIDPADFNNRYLSKPIKK